MFASAGELGKYNMRKGLKELFKKIKLLILDVDGVLTRGEIIYDDKGRELKVFNVKDGFGVFILSKVGIKTVLLSARNSPVLKKRAENMQVAEVIGGMLPKEKELARIKREYNVKNSEICFIGDDLIDLGMIKAVGLGIAVGDAVSGIKGSADYITKKRGGEGAVREVVDLIIEAKGLSKRVANWLRDPK